MASQKLTNSVRDKIVQNALKNAFAVELEALDADKVAFAKMVYDHIVPREHQEVLAKVPKEYLNRSYTITIKLRAPGSDTPAYTRVSVSMGEERPQPHDLFYNNCSIEDATLYAVWSKINERGDRIHNARAKLREKITQVVQSVSTVKRLLEVWPEGKEFIPAIALAPAASLPAVVVGDLNDMLAKALRRPLTA